MRYWLPVVVVFSLLSFIVDKTALAQDQPKKTPKIVEDDPPPSGKKDPKDPKDPMMDPLPKPREVGPKLIKGDADEPIMKTPDIPVPNHSMLPKPLYFTLKNTKDEKVLILNPAFRPQKYKGTDVVDFGDKEADIEAAAYKAIFNIWKGDVITDISVTSDGKLFYKDTQLSLQFASNKEALPKDDQPAYFKQFTQHALSVLEAPRRESLTNYNGKRLYFAVYQRKEGEKQPVRFDTKEKEEEAIAKIALVLNGKDVLELEMKDTRRPIFKDAELYVYFYEEKEVEVDKTKGLKGISLTAVEAREINHIWLRHARQILVTERAAEKNRLDQIAAAGKLIEQSRGKVEDAETILAAKKVLTADEKKTKIAEVDAVATVLKQARDLLRTHGKDEAIVKKYNDEIADLSGRASRALDKLPFPFVLTMPKGCSEFKIVQEAKVRYALKTKDDKAIARFKVIQNEFLCAGESMTLKGILEYPTSDAETALEPSLTKGVSSVTTIEELTKLSADNRESVFHFYKEKLTIVLNSLQGGTLGTYEYATIAPNKPGLRFHYKDVTTMTFETDLDGVLNRIKYKSPLPTDQYRFFKEKNGTRIVFVDDKEEKTLETVEDLDLKKISYIEGSIAYLRPKGKANVVRVYKGSEVAAEVAEKEGERFAAIEHLPGSAGYVVKLDGNTATQLEVALAKPTPRLRMLLPKGCESFGSLVHADGSVSLTRREEQETPALRLKPQAIACSDKSASILTTLFNVEEVEGKPSVTAELTSKETNLTLDQAKLNKDALILVTLSNDKITQLQKAAKGLAFSKLERLERKVAEGSFKLEVTGATEFSVLLDEKGSWVTPRWKGPADSKGTYAIAEQAGTSQVFYDNEWVGAVKRIVDYDASAGQLALIGDEFLPSKEITKALKNIEGFSSGESSTRPNRLFVLKQKTWILEAEALDSAEPFAKVSFENLALTGKAIRVGVQFKSPGNEYSWAFALDGSSVRDYLPYDGELIATRRLPGEKVTVEKK